MTLAQTVFSGKGDDELLSKDVYSVSDSGPINKLVSKTGVAQTVGSTVDAIKGTFNNLTDIAKSIATDQNAAKAFVSDMLTLKNAIGGGPLNALKALDTKLVGTMTESMGIGPELKNNIKVAAGDVVYMAKGDYVSAAGLGVLLNQLGGSAAVEVTNLQNEAQILNGMVGMVAESGSLEFIDLMRSNASSDELLNHALRSNMGAFVVKGSIDGLKKVTEVIGGESVLGKDPAVVKNMITNYKDDSMSLVNYTAKMSAVVETFDQVDGSWDSVTRNGKTEDNLGQFVKASEDMVAAMRYEPKYGEMTEVASMFEEVDIKTEAKSWYKHVAIA